jgi:hypothetical protein
MAAIAMHLSAIREKNKELFDEIARVAKIIPRIFMRLVNETWRIITRHIYRVLFP